MAAGNLILFGFMGTGKTSVGRRLADRLALTFVDMDDAIEAREGRSIPEIFATDGENGFRVAEQAVAGELGAGSGQVIATGGGVVLTPANLEALGADGLLICLRARRDTIVARVAGDSNRPLVSGPDAVERIDALLAEREALYAALPHQVWTDGRSIDEVAEEIVQIYRSPGDPS